MKGGTFTRQQNGFEYNLAQFQNFLSYTFPKNCKIEIFHMQLLYLLL